MNQKSTVEILRQKSQIQVDIELLETKKAEHLLELTKINKELFFLVKIEEALDLT